MGNAITGREVFFYDRFLDELNKSKEVKIVVSFLRESGVQLIVKDLKKQAMKGTDIKLLTSNYLNITEPSALYLLKDELGSMIDMKLYKTNEIYEFISTNEFKEVLESAIEDDLSNPEFKKSWIECELDQVRFFTKFEDIFKSIEDTYNTQFKGLLYFDEDVELDEIQKCFEDIKNKFPKIKIKVKVN
jgi:GTP cyclohydrolase III